MNNRVSSQKGKLERMRNQFGGKHENRIAFGGISPKAKQDWSDVLSLISDLSG